MLPLSASAAGGGGGASSSLSACRVHQGSALSFRKMIVDAVSRESDGVKETKSVATGTRARGIPPVFGSNGSRKDAAGAESRTARNAARLQEARRSGDGNPAAASAAASADDGGVSSPASGGDTASSNGNGSGRERESNLDATPEVVGLTEEWKLADSRRRIARGVDDDGKEQGVANGVEARENRASLLVAPSAAPAAGERGLGKTRRDSSLSKLWPTAPVRAAPFDSAKSAFPQPPQQPLSAGHPPKGGTKKAWIWGGVDKGDGNDGGESGGESNGRGSPIAALTLVLDAVRDSGSFNGRGDSSNGGETNSVVDQLTVSENANFGRHRALSAPAATVRNFVFRFFLFFVSSFFVFVVFFFLHENRRNVFSFSRFFFFVFCCLRGERKLVDAVFANIFGLSIVNV